MSSDEQLLYELTVLEKMVAELPASLALLFRQQILKLSAAIHDRDAHMCQMLQTALGDLRLSITTLQFDLEATRRERDDAIRKLKGQK